MLPSPVPVSGRAAVDCSYKPLKRNSISTKEKSPFDVVFRGLNDVTIIFHLTYYADLFILGRVISKKRLKPRMCL
jgi:hypothetical protein